MEVRHFYSTALIVFTHGVQVGGRAAGKGLSGLCLRNRKVSEADTW